MPCRKVPSLPPDWTPNFLRFIQVETKAKNRCSFTLKIRLFFSWENDQKEDLRSLKNLKIHFFRWFRKCKQYWAPLPDLTPYPFGVHSPPPIIRGVFFGYDGLGNFCFIVFINLIIRQLPSVQQTQGPWSVLVEGHKHSHRQLARRQSGSSHHLGHPCCGSRGSLQCMGCRVSFCLYFLQRHFWSSITESRNRQSQKIQVNNNF